VGHFLLTQSGQSLRVDAAVVVAGGAVGAVVAVDAPGAVVVVDAV
jgi:hypothetical protein